MMVMMTMKVMVTTMVTMMTMMVVVTMMTILIMMSTYCYSYSDSISTFESAPLSKRFQRSLNLKNDDRLHSKQITRAIRSTMIVGMVTMMIRMTMKK